MSVPIPVFTGVVDGRGKLILDGFSLFERYVRTLKNQAVQVVLKKQTRTKSHGQLGYLYGVLYPIIADDLGYRQYEVEEVHDACMRQLRGLKPEPNPLKLRVSLREMTHDEVSDYISDLRHWALMDFGIATPDAQKAEAA